MNLAPLGDRAILITLGASIDDATHRRVRAFCARVEKSAIPGVIEMVPAFASVALHYDPLRLEYDELAKAVAPLLKGLDSVLLPQAREVEIPVWYGGAAGPDLDQLARMHDLTVDDVVSIHTASDYLVHMIGFAPGFPYLGGLDPRIATPRRDTPRTRVLAGSVGIGGSQTGVYPIESPGGWQLIGRTPLALFDAARSPLTLLRASDHVRFRAISEEEFARLRRA